MYMYAYIYIYIHTHTHTLLRKNNPINKQDEDIRTSSINIKRKTRHIRTLTHGRNI